MSYKEAFVSEKGVRKQTSKSVICSINIPPNSENIAKSLI